MSFQGIVTPENNDLFVLVNTGDSDWWFEDIHTIKVNLFVR